MDSAVSWTGQIVTDTVGGGVVSHSDVYSTSFPTAAIKCAWSPHCHNSTQLMMRFWYPNVCWNV